MSHRLFPQFIIQSTNNIIPSFVQVPVIYSSQVPLKSDKSVQTSRVSLESDCATQTEDLSTEGQICQHVVKNFKFLQTRILKWGTFSEHSVVEITRLRADLLPNNGGPSTLAKVLFYISDGTVQFCVSGMEKPLVTKEAGVDYIDYDVLDSVLGYLSPRHVFCAGIENSEYESVCKDVLPSYISKESGNYRSTRCAKWFELASNCKAENRAYAFSGQGRCVHCSEGYRYARRSKRCESAEKKAERVQPHSKYPVNLLTQDELRERYQGLRRQYNNLTGKMKRLQRKLDDFTVELPDHQSKELEDFVSSVKDKDVDLVLSESIPNDLDASEQQMYQEMIRKAFMEDQQKNRAGNQGNRWSMVTYRIALSIYSRSPASYEALRSWKIFQLPSKSSLKQYSSALLHTSGVDFDYLKDQAIRYEAFKAEKVQNDHKEPIGVGVLILDEVKVIGKIIWNSKNGEISGTAMDSDEIRSVKDIFKKLSDPTPEAAEYFLQFLWRDLSSNYDVIGPHYSASRTMDTNFTTNCLVDCLHAFQQFDFKVACIVLDGASTNLAMIKQLSGSPRGAYGFQPNEPDPHEIKPWFDNPSYSGERIFFIVCPTHQLKNMVNQLFASQEGGAKQFITNQNGAKFGWKQIVGMWTREKRRRDDKNPRLVPKLVKAYIDRDAWTKLNVKPAKIMQQPHVLRELYSYANPGIGNRPQDAAAVMATHGYLQACSQLFEMGFLNSSSDSKIFDPNDSRTLESIDNGFKFFREWFERLKLECPDFKETSPKEERFISWQTYDLLRVCYYGFREFCTYFLGRHPGYYVVPMKVNGSAIETLFSQFKFSAGSKLTSVNYPTAKRAVMLKRNIHGHHTSGTGYRDMPLYTHDIPLQKKRKT